MKAVVLTMKNQKTSCIHFYTHFSMIVLWYLIKYGLGLNTRYDQRIWPESSPKAGFDSGNQKTLAFLV